MALRNSIVVWDLTEIASNCFGVQIYGKCEFLNPGGSVKDRVAAQIVGEVRAKFRVYTSSYQSFLGISC